MRTNVARHMYRRRDANRADDTRIAIAVARFDAVAFANRADRRRRRRRRVCVRGVMGGDLYAYGFRALDSRVRWRRGASRRARCGDDDDDGDRVRYGGEG